MNGNKEAGVHVKLSGMNCESSLYTKKQLSAWVGESQEIMMLPHENAELVQNLKHVFYLNNESERALERRIKQYLKSVANTVLRQEGEVDFYLIAKPLNALSHRQLQTLTWAMMGTGYLVASGDAFEDDNAFRLLSYKAGEKLEVYRGRSDVSEPVDIHVPNQAGLDHKAGTLIAFLAGTAFVIAVVMVGLFLPSDRGWVLLTGAGIFSLYGIVQLIINLNSAPE